MTETICEKQFKAAMRNLASGVTLITSASADARGGMTATAVCSLSATPPQILICVNRNAATHDLIANSGKFCVNVLAADQTPIASMFSSGVEPEQRFASGDWTALTTGAPVLVNALAAFDCELAEAIASSTHSIFIGRVVNVSSAEEDLPLLYYRSNYAALASSANP